MSEASKGKTNILTYGKEKPIQKKTMKRERKKETQINIKR
jgi:hypothetical protein